MEPAEHRRARPSGHPRTTDARRRNLTLAGASIASFLVALDLLFERSVRAWSMDAGLVVRLGHPRELTDNEPETTT